MTRVLARVSVSGSAAWTGRVKELVEKSSLISPCHSISVFNTNMVASRPVEQTV
jgi:hypothetical protein